MPITLNRRWRVLLRRHGPASAVWRRRIAMGAGAVTVGLAALLFARMADEASRAFSAVAASHHYWPLVITPLGFAAIAALTRLVAPEAAGSGIPQVIAAAHDVKKAARILISLKAGLLKCLFTVAALLCGASVGREGPTVQVSAAVMTVYHRVLRAPMRSSMIIAGGAAGVAAAFNTPLAGVTFAIEELADAYEQRVALLVMTTILIAGVVSLGLSGDYIYFGVVGQTMNVGAVLRVAPVAGVLGGLTGGLFARAMLGAGAAKRRWLPFLDKRPVLWALICGLAVAAIGVATGLTWGTGYSAARAIIDGTNAPWWFGPAKFGSTLATAAGGLPGGIFAPSLATGSGLGAILRVIFPDDPGGAVVLLGMVAYFTGVVRAPLTAVIIIVEATASRGLILPLFLAALIAHAVSALVCKERLYHGLARPWREKLAGSG
ncbi:MAG: chloride channel protein [Sphingomonas sp.]|uniref:chloride channel protein n=1 Tax=Sphingomonas sp. TaxID=28214 RepID=UPI00121342B5|nr:chloride channel protein [Sphingomonas sp.]THD35288.1 MAG: chloride channel protein [Sphingomonas sp.]